MYEPGIGRKPASELSDFIDVDGVLNNGTWAIEMFDKGLRVYHDDLLYKPALEQLKRIVDATGAVIVESFAWRQIPNREDVP